MTNLEAFIAANPSDPRVVRYQRWAAKPINRKTFRYPAGLASLLSDAAA